MTPRSWTLFKRLEHYTDKSGGPDTCWIWSGPRRGRGYGGLKCDGKQHLAHRLTYIAKVGAIPIGLYVCHTCDNKLCQNPAHFFLGTHADNMADKIQKGREAKNKGKKNGRARLSENDVREIRNAPGLIALSRLYGVSTHTIWKIKQRKSWTHVQ